MLSIETTDTQYIINNNQYTRVTYFRDNILFKPFDKLKISENIVRSSLNGKNTKYNNMSQQDILNEWDNTALLGTLLHDYIEKELSDNSIGKSQKIPKEIRNECKEFHKFIRNYEKKYPNYQYKVEFLIYDNKYKLAGRVDCLFYDGEKYHLYDWKRTQNVKHYTNEYGIHPYTNNILANKYNKYSIQLNIYAQILRDNYNIDVENRMYLVVFNKDNPYERILVNDYRDNIKKMLSLKYRPDVQSK